MRRLWCLLFGSAVRRVFHVEPRKLKSFFPNEFFELDDGNVLDVFRPYFQGVAPRERKSSIEISRCFFISKRRSKLFFKFATAMFKRSDK
jgi:hypothetical protein